MRLFAISDLHVGYQANREAISAISSRPSDWLALVGDVGELPEQLDFVFGILGRRFKQLVWVPGNHELWTEPWKPGSESSEERYARHLDVARRYGVITPEDHYPEVEFGGDRYSLCPLFTLYDYSFRPANVALDQAINWALEADVFCSDEARLKVQPYGSVVEWCRIRCTSTERRLRQLGGKRSILIGHFPLRYDLVTLPRIPRFSIWCGTQLTADWHQRFNAELVVFGHLHVPSVQFRDGVRFEEVSLGYPGQRSKSADINQYVRQVLP